MSFCNYLIEKAFVEAGFSIVQEDNLWLKRYILSYLGKFTCIWPNHTLLKNYICPSSLVCLSYSGINSLKIPSVTAFFSIVNKVNKYSTILSLFSCCIIFIIWYLVQENKVMIITGKRLLCQYTKKGNVYLCYDTCLHANLIHDGFLF